MADETAICVASISKQDPTKIYIRELIKDRMGFPDMIEAVKQAYKFYNAKILCIEKAASGQSLIQVLRKEAKIPIEEMRPLKSKTIRLQAVCPLMESMRVFFVEDYWTNTLIKELTSFPFVRHDDSTDAFTWALTYYLMRMDVVDRGMQEAIIMNKRFKGELLREGVREAGVFEQLNARRNSFYGNDVQVNNPDYDSNVSNSPDPRSPMPDGIQDLRPARSRFPHPSAATPSAKRPRKRSSLALQTANRPRRFPEPTPIPTD
jgi:predicted phage terminase large subunit-like protein